MTRTITHAPDELNEQTVAELVTADPRRAAVFERLGIDYCCGGNVPLGDACIERGLEPETVQGMLDAATATTSAEPDLGDASVDELIDDIVERHHGLLRAELPRLTLLAHKVARAHGAKERRLVDAEAVFVQFVDEMRAHTEDEEDRVFPACRQAVHAKLDAEAATEVADWLGRIVEEHDEAGAHLARLRELLDDFEPPAQACTSWRAYLDGLARLEQDMHRHVHKENYVLVPKVMDHLYAAGAERS